MPTVREIQQALNDGGFGPVVVDGFRGPRTIDAIKEFQRANNLEADGIVGSLTTAVMIAKGLINEATSPPDTPIGVLPTEWLQPANITRVHLHWTAGSHKPSDFDKDHYHILIAGNGGVVRGNCDLSANSTTAPRGRKAHHTLNANTGAAAVSMACMGDAVERPFNPGRFPLTNEQWDKAAIVTAELCRHYRVPVNPRTVLSHAEVQANLGIRQRGKWDVAILPFDTAYDTARECGDRFRRQVQSHLNGVF